MIYIWLTLVIFILELMIKNYIVKTKKENEKQCIIKNELYIEYTKNKGAIYSSFEDKSNIVRGVSVVILAIMGIMYVFVLWGKDNKITKLGMSLIMAGGLSNVYDRVKRRYVVDYIYLRRIKKIVFNIADVCICIGSILLTIGEFRKH